jgi:5'-methylthioadenosine phosphorylase
MLAIIGGSGLAQLANLRITHRQVMRTPYGEPSGALTFGILGEQEIIFLARHGYGHTIPPHLVNYRANLWALRDKGVTSVISVASVGGIHAELTPGTLVVPHQILDYTHGRDATYSDGRERTFTHIDFTHPYTPGLRQEVLEAARCAKEPCRDGGVYAATQGPRLETAAEIDRFERDGADMVGMTGMPEAALAREIGLHYAAIAVVMNHAAGRGDSRDGISMERVADVARDTMGRVRRVLEKVVVHDVC